jgi:hypothetical protein
MYKLLEMKKLIYLVAIAATTFAACSNPNESDGSEASGSERREGSDLGSGGSHTDADADTAGFKNNPDNEGGTPNP